MQPAWGNPTEMARREDSQYLGLLFPPVLFTPPILVSGSTAAAGVQAGRLLGSEGRVDSRAESSSKISGAVTSCEPGAFCVIWKLNIKKHGGFDMGQWTGWIRYRFVLCVDGGISLTTYLAGNSHWRSHKVALPSFFTIKHSTVMWNKHC